MASIGHAIVGAWAARMAPLSGARGRDTLLLSSLALLARVCGTRPGRTGIAVGLVVASHGLLDALTDGGLGVALLWPFSDERFFAPWRPLPIAPIGSRFWSARGLAVAATELAWFLPLLVSACWPRRLKP